MGGGENAYVVVHNGQLFGVCREERVVLSHERLSHLLRSLLLACHVHLNFGFFFFDV